MRCLDPGQITTSTFRRVQGEKLPVFHQTKIKIQLTSDTEGQSCEDGRRGAKGTRADDKYKRFTGPGSVRCTVEIVLGVLLSRWAS